jgi:t-SNARE complex subunit (syntaxin)
MQTLNEKRDTRLRKNLGERCTDTWRDKCEKWLSSNTTTSKNIKQEYSKTMNPPEIINKNYTPDQKGQEIRQEDVVQPLNRKITAMKEMERVQQISCTNLWEL